MCASESRTSRPAAPTVGMLAAGLRRPIDFDVISDGPREVDRHRRPFPEFALYLDGAAGLPREAVDHRQTQARPHALGLGRKEGFERLTSPISWSTTPA